MFQGLQAEGGGAVYLGPAGEPVRPSHGEDVGAVEGNLIVLRRRQELDVPDGLIFLVEIDGQAHLVDLAVDGLVLEPPVVGGAVQVAEMGVEHDVRVVQGEGNPLDGHVEVPAVEVGALRRIALGGKADLHADLLEQHILLHPDQVGRVRRRNVFPAKDGKRENQEWINRVFSRRQFHYAGRIHEQLISLDGAPYQTFKTPVVLYHTGYDLSPEEKLAKAQRNIRLLERELLELQKRGQTDDAMTEAKEEAEALIPYILYQLGKSYYLSEDYGKACDYFSQGLSYELNPSLEYVIDMVETYGYALINGGGAQEALFFENIYEEFGRSADFQFLMGLIYMNNMRFDDAVHEFQKASCQKECRTIGVNDWLAYYNIGVIHECLGQKEKAAEWYRKCKNYPQAQARLREIRGGNEQGAGQENRS